MIFLISGLFLYASWKDFKTLEVPLWISPTIVVIQIVRDIMIDSPYFFQGLIFYIILFGLFLFFAQISDIGGADCLIAAAIGYSLGVCSLQAILIGMSLCFIYTLYMKLTKNEKPYPLVPFLTAGYLIENTILYIGGIAK